jgi:1-aminocyclopropane-1-carboxylate deaminase
VNNPEKKIKNQPANLKYLESFGVELYMKREDEIHPFISGNKYRKLKYNILQADKQGKKTLLTFGGAFSNHISAVAYAGHEFKFETIGIIRGDELGIDLDKTLLQNPTLKTASDHGMKFKFVTRSEYREKHSIAFIKALKEEFGDFYLVPEGGTNKLAVKGCEEILKPGDESFDVICCAIGTGGTISGLINSIGDHQKVLGFPALKGDFLENEIKKYTIEDKNWSLINRYHFGGFGKISKELVDFMNDFHTETGIPLDPVYTGKMMFGIADMIQKGYFSKGTRILAIHTGGLQGIDGMNIRLRKKKMPVII